MPNNYCTAEEIKAAMPDTTWDSSYDAEFIRLAVAASRAIDRFTKRPPGFWYVSVDETRYFDGSGSGGLWIGYLAAAPTSVSVAESGDVADGADAGGTYTAWAASDYLLWPYNAAYDSEPYRRIDIDGMNGSKSGWYRFAKAVKIVGKFGWATAVPAEIKEITIIQAARWFKRGQQAYQDTGAVSDLGQLQYVQKLDPDIAVLIDFPPFREVAI